MTSHDDPEASGRADHTTEHDWLISPFTPPAALTPDHEPAIEVFDEPPESHRPSPVRLEPRRPHPVRTITSSPRTRPSTHEVTDNVTLYRDAHLATTVRVGSPVAVLDAGQTTFVGIVAKITGGVAFLTYRPADAPHRVPLGAIIAVGSTTVPHPDELPEISSRARHV